eukprot:Rhum_TRINITY_DN14305_c29_g1::Rhum_TRINITY_DN14305_c29_g1_i1::g.80287::m.80287
MSDLDTTFRENSQALVKKYGAITRTTKSPDGQTFQALYTNGYKCFFKPSGARLEHRDGGKLQIFVDTKGVMKRRDPNNASVLHPFVDDAPAPAPAANGAAKEVTPKAKPAKRPRESESSSDSDSDSESSSGSGSGSDSSSDDKIPAAKRARVAPKPKAPTPAKKTTPKAKPAKAAKKPAPKRKIVADDSSSEEEEAKKDEPVDLNDDTRATLGMIALELAKTMDLGDAAEEERKRLAAEEAKNKKAPKKPSRGRFPANLDALVKKVDTLEASLTKHKANMATKDDTKEVSLSTSKTNYIDPRVCTAWCKRYEVNPKKVYTQTLIDKFKWASGVPETWRF